MLHWKLRKYPLGPAILVLFAGENEVGNVVSSQVRNEGFKAITRLPRDHSEERVILISKSKEECQQALAEFSRDWFNKSGYQLKTQKDKL